MCVGYVYLVTLYYYSFDFSVTQWLSFKACSSICQEILLQIKICVHISTTNMSESYGHVWSMNVWLPNVISSPTILN